MADSFAKTLGLTEDETRAYLLLLENGPLSVQNIARKLGMPRPSLYGFFKRLEDKGAVKHLLSSKKRLYAAEPPEALRLLLEKEATEVRERQKSLEALLPSLKRKTMSVSANPRFELFEGAKGLQYVLRDMLLYRDIETYAFWPIKAMVDILSPEFFKYHNKERIRNNIYTNAIWPADQTVKIKDHPYLGSGAAFKREIRIAPKGMSFAMGYWIYGDKVALISSRKESFGFIIESREFAQMLLAQFQFVWKSSKKI